MQASNGTPWEVPAQRLPSAYRPEPAVVAECRRCLEGVLDWSEVQRVARPWVDAVRRHPPHFWSMESLLREYPLSSAEGLALMRLAEALLRVPDQDTAVALAADQLGSADFHARQAPADEPLAHAAQARLVGLALVWAQSLLSAGTDGAAGLMARLGAEGVVAAARRAVALLGRQFVFAPTIAEALAVSDAQRPHDAMGVCHSFDMLGEGARTAVDAARYLDQYRQAVQALAERATVQGYRAPWAQDGLSIKLSALHPRYEAAQRDRVLAELVPVVWSLCEVAASAHLNLTLDAEEVDRLELSLEVLEALVQRVAVHCPQWQGLGLALQAYQTRALPLVAHVIALARQYGVQLMCRLVKGAYWDGEIKRAQELGLAHYPVFTRKAHTDLSYLACAHALLAAPDAVYPQFASHNAATLAAVQVLARQVSRAPDGVPGFEWQRLHGMGEGVHRELQRSHPAPLRLYAPVGTHRDLLAYLVRRLLENGANASFVRQLMDPAVPVDALLVAPWHDAETHGRAEVALPLPPQLFGSARANSLGLDGAEPAQRWPLEAAWQALPTDWPAGTDATLAEVPEAFARAQQAWPAWSATPVAERSACLRRAADALQADMPRWCAWLVREARKTWSDAVAEVRETIDGLRYSTQQAAAVLQPMVLPGPTGEYNEWRLRARGVWVCISPWNFPLAIFMNQVAAAVVTGNAVLAKPAEQTPGLAWEAVRLLHAAGVPTEVLQCLPGPGETVGEALVAQAGVAGVVFTGSTAVAKRIQRLLAGQEGPIVPLIAETGGLNAMLVDATALPEQVCDAVVQSAFRSAGQRCSALRLLCVHEAVADTVVHMVRGAMQTLVVGEPHRWDTDVGPLIDATAHARVSAQLAGLRQRAQALWAPAPTAPGDHVPPQLFELRDMADLREEIFGPVLCVLRWGPGVGDGALASPEAVIDRVNALGYGLTLGVHTRIGARARALAAQARVGNVYVNRNIVGAVVGVQPFGGEGLSGTGPKAGGPQYLARFCTEQTLTINTAAAGGNADLLA